MREEFRILTIVSLAAAIIGVLGAGLKNSLLLAFILGFFVILLSRSRDGRGYGAVFASSIAGGLTSSIMGVLLYFLLKIFFYLALLLIALYLVGLLIYYLRKGGLR